MSSILRCPRMVSMHEKKIKNSKKGFFYEHLIVWLSILLGLAVAFIDALLDYFFFYRGRSLIDLLITDVPAHEIYIRLVIFLMFIAFGFLAQRQISREKKISDRLEKMIRERDFLLRELNHRVKNNLQVISGIIDLKKRQSGAQETQEILTELRTRCDSISSVHKLLYRESSIDRIRLDIYIRDFIERLNETLTGDRQIEIHISTDEVTVPVDTAIPCGLILNELVLNCYKHAFPDARSGRIDISLRNTVNRGIELKVRDDGTGFQETNDISGTLGLTLVHGLARQINAEIEFQNNYGTTAVLTITGNGE